MKVKGFLILILAYPLAAAGAVPAPAVHIVWHFDGGITNDLGGRYNVFKREPSWARTYLDSRAGRGHSLRVTTHRESQGFCGLWLDFRPASGIPRQFFDASGFLYLSFWAKGEKGGEDFDITLTDEATLDNEGARHSRPLRKYIPGGLAATWRHVVIPLADFQGIDRSRLVRMTLSVRQKGDFRFYLDDIGFQHDPAAAAPMAKKSRAAAKTGGSGGATRAIWAWKTKPLFDSGKSQELERFLAFCAAQKVDTVYLAAEFDGIGDASGTKLRLRNPDGYRAFLRRAHQRGLKVDALAGTPEWAVRENHPQALAAIEAVLEFQQAGSPAERFEGIHFDVEPYLLLGYSDPAYRTEILLGLVQMSDQCSRLTRAAGLTFSCDIPSWFYAPSGLERDRLIVRFNGQEKTAGEHLTDLADSVTIMDYTNQADGAGGIIARGLPALEYAASRNKKIIVGVETFSESDSPVTFVCGLPAEDFWPRLALSSLRNQLRFEDFRMSLFTDDVNVHIGLSTPRAMATERRAAFEAALARLARQLGASSDPLRYPAREIIDTARAALAQDSEWKDFESFEFPDPDDGRRIQGFCATRRMIPSITFYGLGGEVFREEIDSTVEWLSRHPSFGGMAVHFYESFRELMEASPEGKLPAQSFSLTMRDFSRRSLNPQEIRQQLFSGFSEDGFGVELHAFDLLLLVAEAHDESVGG